MHQATRALTSFRWSSRPLAGLLLVALLALSACATPSAEIVLRTVVVTREVERTVVVTQEVPVEKTVPVTVTPAPLVVVNSANAAPADDPLALAHQAWSLAAFRRLHPEVLVHFTSYRYAAESFAARQEAGVLEDAFVVPFSAAPALVAARKLANVDALTRDFPHRDAYNPEILGLVQDAAGQAYGLPHTAYGLGLLYNRRLFEEAGLDPDRPPETWDAVREDARRIQEALGVDGFNLRNEGGLGGWMLTAMMVSRGGEAEVQEDGVWLATYNNDATVAALRWLHALRWEDGSTTDEIDTWGTYPMAVDFAEGRVAMTLADAGMLRWMFDNLPDLAIEDVGFGRMPDGGANATLGGGGVWLYNPASPPEVVEAAFAFNTWREFDLTAYEQAVQARAEAGEWVGLPRVRLFTGDYGDRRDAILADHANLPVGNYAGFNQALIAVRNEPPVATQALYEALGEVVQQVLSSPNPDIPALLDASAARFQDEVLSPINVERIE